MKLLIGTVSLNTRPLTEIWLETLYESLNFANYKKDDVKIVIIDNGSEDNVMDLAKDYNDVVFIRHEKNIGVSPAWNEIIKVGFSGDKPLYDYYLPANNDIYFTKKWYKNFIECLSQNDGSFGWISSMMNDYKEPEYTGITETVELEGRYWGGIRPNADDVETKAQMVGVLKTAYAPWGGIEKFSDLLETKYRIGLKEMHPKAPLFALSAKCIKEVGLFDEYNAPVGIHEDADMCLRIGAAGLKIGAAFGAYVQHFSMMSRSKGEFVKGDWWVESREKAFQEKWGHSSKGMTSDVVKNRRFKLDVGSGERSRKEDGEHWYHLDIDPIFPDVEFLNDASKPLPFKDNSLSEIFCSNNLEHQEWKQIKTILTDWYNKLDNGGKLHLRVPNFRFLVEEYLAGRWKMSLEDGVDFNAMHAIYGGDHPGCPHLHKVGFDYGNLSRVLSDVGFNEISNVSGYGSWELRVEARK
jgi:GT2 family glycosyltransferase